MTIKSKQKLVVITRAIEDGVDFQLRLEKEGFKAYQIPAIRLARRKMTKPEIKLLANLDQFDLCIFTSRHSVFFFLEALLQNDIPKEHLRKVKIAAVGEVTAESIREIGLQVDSMPASFSNADLAKELGDVAGKKILIPHSAVASRDLENTLTNNGAKVSIINLYTTIAEESMEPEALQLLESDTVGCLTFASSSAVTGFVGLLRDAILLKKVLQIPVVCIGPSTALTAGQKGFTSVHTASVFTTDGIIETLKHI